MDINTEDAYNGYQAVNICFSVATSIYFLVKLVKIYANSSCRRNGCAFSCMKPTVVPAAVPTTATPVSPVIDVIVPSSPPPINEVIHNGCGDGTVPTIERSDSLKSIELRQDRIVSKIMEMREELTDNLLLIKNIVETLKPPQRF